MKTYSNIEKAIASIGTRGGFTYSFRTQELNPKTGFSIAISKNYEQTIPNIVRYKKSIIRDKIKAYALDHMDILNNPNRYLGCWIYNGKLYLDITEVVPENREEVEKLCLERGQSAYWDNATGKALFVTPSSYFKENQLDFYDPLDGHE